MLKTQVYPQLEIDLKKFRENVQAVKKHADDAGVGITGIVKGYWALPKLSKIVSEAGVAQMGSSRLSQIEELIEMGVPGPYMLIRIPMLSEIKDVARLCDYSLESDITVIQALNDECALLGKKHKVLLMMDMGDLREGIWDKETAVAAAVHIDRDLENLELAGIATFVGCYGSILLTPDKMQEFADLADAVEEAVGHPLEMISAGGSNEYVVFARGQLNPKINHMRIGEIYSAPLGVMTNYKTRIPYIHTDVFTFRAEVVEVEIKPSYPQGTIGSSAWGEEGPHYVDRGMRKRAVLAFGRADCAEPARLMPRLKGIEILGASSDHTIIDIEDCEKDICVGDIVEFDIEYGTMLSLTGALDVVKVYKD